MAPSTTTGRGNWHRSMAYSITPLLMHLVAVPDAYSIAIGHREGDRFVIDVVRGHHGTPHKTTKEYAALCKQYRIRTVVGDKYAKQWVQDAWRAEGFTYVEADEPAAQLYLEAQPQWVRGAVRIYNDPVLIKELRHLECIPGRIGADQVTHPRNMHDDLANAVCGCVTLMAKLPTHIPAWYSKMQIERSSAGAAARRMGVYGAEWGGMGESAYLQMRRRGSATDY